MRFGTAGPAGRESTVAGDPEARYKLWTFTCLIRARALPDSQWATPEIVRGSARSHG